MPHGRGEAILLPNGVADTPDEFERCLGPFGGDRLLQREELVVPSDSLATRTFGRSPRLPLVLDIPIEQLLDFRVVFQQLTTNFALAFVGDHLRLKLRHLLGTLRESDPRLKLLIQLGSRNLLQARHSQPHIIAFDLKVELQLRQPFELVLVGDEVVGWDGEGGFGLEFLDLLNVVEQVENERCCSVHFFTLRALLGAGRAAMSCVSQYANSSVSSVFVRLRFSRAAAISKRALNFGDTRKLIETLFSAAML